MIVDLRSDTVTKPTAGMLQAMMHAQTGDDVFGDDPTVNALEEKVKELFGTEAALFCPTATMCNQIALKILTNPLDEIICDRIAHIYVYEVAGYAFHSGCSIRYLHGDRGVFTAKDVLKNINPVDVHKPITSLVSVENTVNRGGGRIYPIEIMREIATVCNENNLRLHLDGSRLFNALVETKESPAVYGKMFDTITLCLSKGLGCAVGAVLTGKEKYLAKARRVRKVLGGGMRQAGILAAGGIYALDNHINRLKDDHRRAAQVGAILQNAEYVSELLPVETNIIIFRLHERVNDNAFISYLAENSVKAFTIGDNCVRFVMHLDIDDEMIAHTISVVENYKVP